MAIIFLYDERIPVSVVKADLIMRVSENDNILIKIKELAGIIQSKFISVSPGWSHELHICCNSSNLGLQLGSGIDHQNIEKVFSVLKFKVGNIIIDGCGATLVYPSGNNGILMCKKLAHAVYSNVTASNNIKAGKIYTYTQNTSGSKGNTVTWNQSGNLQSLQEFDNDGSLVYSIQHPGVNTLNKFKRSCIQAKLNTKSNLSVKHLLTVGIRKINQLLFHYPQHPAVVKVAVRP